jgi:hypothetical protein
MSSKSFPNQNSVHIPCLLHLGHIPSPSQSPRFRCPDKTSWLLQICVISCTEIFQVLAAVNMPMLLFWVVAPCGLVDRYQCFGGTYCLEPLKMEKAYFSRNVCIYLQEHTALQLRTLHAPAALPPVPTGQEAGLAPEPVWTPLPRLEPQSSSP